MRSKTLFCVIYAFILPNEETKLLVQCFHAQKEQESHYSCGEDNWKLQFVSRDLRAIRNLSYAS